MRNFIFLMCLLFMVPTSQASVIYNGFIDDRPLSTDYIDPVYYESLGNTVKMINTYHVVSKVRDYYGFIGNSTSGVTVYAARNYGNNASWNTLLFVNNLDRPYFDHNYYNEESIYYINEYYFYHPFDYWDWYWRLLELENYNEDLICSKEEKYIYIPEPSSISVLIVGSLLILKRS